MYERDEMEKFLDHAVKPQHPCEECELRSAFAHEFDAHFWGDDCPYICEQYKVWRFQHEHQSV